MPVPVPASATSGVALGDRASDGFGHRELLRAQAEARQRAGERAAVAEDRGERAVASMAVREGDVAQRLAFLPAGGAAGAGVVRGFHDDQDFLDAGDALLERLVGHHRARLVVVVGFARFPREAGHRGEPEFLQRLRRLGRLLRDRRVAQRALIGLGHVLPLLDEAVLALGAVRAFSRLLVAELDDLDALHVLAHRVEVRDGVEVAVERRPLVGVRADVVVRGTGIAADGLGAHGKREDRQEGEGDSRYRHAIHVGKRGTENRMLPASGRVAQAGRSVEGRGSPEPVPNARRRAAAPACRSTRWGRAGRRLGSSPAAGRRG